MRIIYWPLVAMFVGIVFGAGALIGITASSESELASKPVCYLGFVAATSDTGIVLALLPADCPQEEPE